MSEASHSVDVVPVELHPCPGADSLSLVKIGGFQVVVRTEDWVGRVNGAYVPPDSLVDTTRPEFSFLAKQAYADGYARIRAVKLRGNVSMGLLVPTPLGHCLGDDVTEALGVKHYQPEVRSGTPRGSNQRIFEGACPGPKMPFGIGKYDLENGRKPKFASLIPLHTLVVVTEKLHGENARYQWSDGKLHVGSRNHWLKDGSNWHTVEGIEDIEALCAALPGYTIFGELYGGVGGFPYDARPGARRFRLFDILDPAGNWVPYEMRMHTAEAYDVERVPCLYWGPFDPVLVAELADAPVSTLANHIREGVVVETLGINRVKLKWHGAEFLTKKNVDVVVSDE